MADLRLQEGVASADQPAAPARASASPLLALRAGRGSLQARASASPLLALRAGRQTLHYRPPRVGGADVLAVGAAPSGTGIGRCRWTMAPKSPRLYGPTLRSLRSTSATATDPHFSAAA